MIRTVTVVFFALFAAMIAIAIVVPDSPDKIKILDLIGQGVFASLVVLAICWVFLVVRWLLWVLRGPRRARAARPTGTPIIVDGSNVMHWGGEPSLMVLLRILNDLQDGGYYPLVYFDANVGYKLSGDYADAAEMARQLMLRKDQVFNAPNRVPADEILLEHAVRDGLRVVTNDRFLDWKTQFPKVGERGFLVKGRWQEGTVIWRGLKQA